MGGWDALLRSFLFPPPPPPHHLAWPGLLVCMDVTVLRCVRMYPSIQPVRTDTPVPPACSPSYSVSIEFAPLVLVLSYLFCLFCFLCRRVTSVQPILLGISIALD